MMQYRIPGEGRAREIDCRSSSSEQTTDGVSLQYSSTVRMQSNCHNSSKLCHAKRKNNSHSAAKNNKSTTPLIHMIAADEVSNFEAFRDCVSDLLIAKLSASAAGDKSRRKRTVKGRKNEIKPVSRPAQAEGGDAAELGETIEVCHPMKNEREESCW